jgi:hypothetical protein
MLAKCVQNILIGYWKSKKKGKGEINVLKMYYSVTAYSIYVASIWGVYYAK